MNKRANESRLTTRGSMCVCSRNIYGESAVCGTLELHREKGKESVFRKLPVFLCRFVWAFNRPGRTVHLLWQAFLLHSPLPALPLLW